MTQSRYLTNIASEFFAVSLLTRLGLDAALTLGNKKRVDIVVTPSEGRSLTIDVKAVAGKMDWLLGNGSAEPDARHFVMLIGYEGRFADPLLSPRVWVVPSRDLARFTKTAKNGKTRYVPRKAFLEGGGDKYEGESGWKRLRGEA